MKKQQYPEQQPSGNILNQRQGIKQVDGPDEPVVNTEEQNKPVNPEDEQFQEQEINTAKGNGTTTGGNEDGEKTNKPSSNENKPGTNGR